MASKTLKIEYNGSLRRLTVPVSDLHFDAVAALLKQLLNVSAIEMRYTDEDGDVISIGSEPEFQAAISSFPAGAPVRLAVETSEKVKRARAQPKDVPVVAAAAAAPTAAAAAAAASPAPASAPIAVGKVQAAQPAPAKLVKLVKPASQENAQPAGPSEPASAAAAPAGPSAPPAAQQSSMDPVSAIQNLLQGLGLGVDLAQVNALARDAAEQAASAAVQASKAIGDAARATREGGRQVDRQLEAAVEALVEGSFVDRARAGDLVRQLRQVPQQVLDLFLAVVAAAQSSLSKGPALGLSGTRHWATCDRCSAPIRGTRYKCGNCLDYDLCARCESVQPRTFHDATHVFLKIDSPLAAGVAPWAGRPLLPGNLYQVPARPAWPSGCCVPGGPPAHAPPHPHPHPPHHAWAGVLGRGRGRRCFDAAPARCAAEPLFTAAAASASATAAAPSGAEGQGLARLAGRFVSDVTVPDGTSMPPGASFSKIWQVRAETPFPAGVRLEHVGGDNLGAGRFSDPLPALNQGAEVQVEVSMRAPDREGRYVSYWRFAAPDGQRFGHRMWADVIVVRDATDIDVNEDDGGMPPAIPLTASDFVDDNDDDDDDDEPCPPAIPLTESEMFGSECPPPLTSSETTGTVDPLPAAGGEDGALDGKKKQATSTTAQAQAQAQAQTIATPFYDELQQLRSMGFGDEARSLRLLAKENGDLLRTVSALLRDEDAN